MEANVDSIRETVSEQSDRLREIGSEAAKADEQLRAYLLERPFLSLAVALAAGYVVGRAVARYA